MQYPPPRIEYPESIVMEKGKLPRIPFRIMPKDARRPIVPDHLEITMIRIEPPVNHLSDFDLSLIQPEPPRGLFAPVS